MTDFDRDCHLLEEVLATWPAQPYAEVRRQFSAGRRLLSGARLHLPILPDLGPWTPLLQLAHGWRILAAIAATLGRDPSVPRRAGKIGNPALETP